MLEIGTKSVYPPIKVKIHGTIYEAKPMSREVLRKTSALEKRIKNGELECTYDQVELLFGKKPIFEKLELREVNEIINYIAVQAFRAEKSAKIDAGGDLAKNGSGSGDKK